ncbi:MAG: Fic family protein [Vicinamibacterales bacterium]
MMTLSLFEQLVKDGRLSVPASVAWTLEEVGTSRGRQELFAKQSLQILKRLRESAIVESAVSSNRIEGVEVDPSRVATVVFGSRVLRDRDEEEVRGYRQALRRVHETAETIEISEASIQELHATSRPGSADAGQYKERDSDIIERRADGSSRVRFRPVSASATPAAMRELVDEWQAWRSGQWVTPLVAAAAFNLDFLCVHPFRDGNGRASRLLFLLQCHQLGYDAGRYISLERIIEENKARYYETLEQSSSGWHERRHDPWPYVNFLLYVLKTAYREFESRVGETTSPRGSKSERLAMAMSRLPTAFRVSDLRRACPGVGIDLVRKFLRLQKMAGELDCSGRGPQATWTKRPRPPN